MTIAKDVQFKGLWKDEPCLIIGSGRGRNYEPFKPELNDFPGKIIGCNTAFKVGYRVDMLLWIDGHVYANNRRAIMALDCIKMSITANPNGTDYIDNGINWIKAIQPDRFSNSFDIGMYPADLSGYLALNAAYLMGCNPIYLSGFTSDSHPEHNQHKRFIWAAKKAAEDGREIYVIDTDSFFCKGSEPIFPFAELPVKIELKDNPVVEIDPGIEQAAINEPVTTIETEQEQAVVIEPEPVPELIEKPEAEEQAINNKQPPTKNKKTRRTKGGKK